MTREELRAIVADAVATVEAFTPRELRTALDSGILDRKFDPDHTHGTRPAHI